MELGPSAAWLPPGTAIAAPPCMPACPGIVIMPLNGAGDLCCVPLVPRFMVPPPFPAPKKPVLPSIAAPLWLIIGDPQPTVPTDAGECVLSNFIGVAGIAPPLVPSNLI